MDQGKLGPLGEVDPVGVKGIEKMRLALEEVRRVEAEEEKRKKEKEEEEKEKEKEAKEREKRKVEGERVIPAEVDRVDDGGTEGAEKDQPEAKKLEEVKSADVEAEEIQIEEVEVEVEVEVAEVEAEVEEEEEEIVMESDDD